MDQSTLWLIGCLVLLLGASCPAQEVTYGVGSWPETMGNHRAIVSVAEKADAVWAHIPWRRPDPSPQRTGILVVQSATGKTVDNAFPTEVSREFGDVIFQADAPGNYEVYYMIHGAQGYKAQQEWLTNAGLDALHIRDAKWKSLPQARVTELQARTEFDRFDPMEVIATREEIDNLLKRNPIKSVLLFPEDRRYPVRMADYLPQKWIKSGPSTEFHGEAARGEYYAFQIGVYAARLAIDSGKDGYGDVQVGLGDLRSASGGVIPSANIHCPSLLGIDWLGRPIGKSFKIALGKVRPLWFGIQVPKDAAPGEYLGTAVIKAFGAPEAMLKVSITVTDKVLEDGGDSEPWRHSRLRWLDSTIGIDDEVVAPYTAIEMRGGTLRVLGREIAFNRLGLPESIKSGGREILARPVEVVVETDGGIAKWGGGSNPKTVKESKGQVIREFGASSDLFTARCQAITDFDGYTNFSVVLKARKDAKVKDIRLEIPMKREVAVYMMGLARKGGLRPKEWRWVWDIGRANNAVWVGDFNAGVQLKLKGPEDTWDIADLRASGLPKSWSNEARGGCTVTDEADCALIRAYSGERTVKKDEEILFRFGMLVTPVKPLDPAHFNQRYYHAYITDGNDHDRIEKVKATGANINNIHHGNALNPYINYPFLTVDKLAAYVKEAHDVGVKVKIYYTVRELSDRCVELWALRSLGDEIFVDGPGGGYPWLQEHLGSRYAPAWVQKLTESETDASIATTGLSRWHNYYLEGLAWLLKNVQIDGLYLDGIGYDREIMMRLRKVMDRTRPPISATGGGCLIDFHSGNEFTYADMRISPACKYMEHFPYINSLWFGEMYDYNESPDYWLVEVSGIPFGLYGEMLQGGGNAWRGMLYGMTNRTGWGGDPKAIWKVWDDFGIAESKMTGYWDPACPVKTDNKDVLATVYSKKGKALISIASWAKGPAKVKLTIDWKALGLDIRKADLSAPAIPGFQEANDFQWTGEIPVEPGKGWLLLLYER